MQRIIGLEMEIRNLVREKDRTTDTMRQMKEDKAMADREIKHLKNLNDTVSQEKKRLFEMIKRHNKKAQS